MLLLGKLLDQLTFLPNFRYKGSDYSINNILARIDARRSYSGASSFSALAVRLEQPPASVCRYRATLGIYNSILLVPNSENFETIKPKRQMPQGNRLSESPDKFSRRDAEQAKIESKGVVPVETWSDWIPLICRQGYADRSKRHALADNAPLDRKSRHQGEAAALKDRRPPREARTRRARDHAGL